MSEAKQMHRDLINALLPILPRTVYGDIRRVVNLVWAIVGLCLTHTSPHAVLLLLRNGSGSFPCCVSCILFTFENNGVWSTDEERGKYSRGEHRVESLENTQHNNKAGILSPEDTRFALYF